MRRVPLLDHGRRSYGVSHLAPGVQAGGAVLGLIVIALLVGCFICDELDRQRRAKNAIEQYKRDLARWRGR